MNERLGHWERYWRQSSFGPVRRATHIVTTEATMTLLHEYYGQHVPGTLRILDLGCGDGALTQQIRNAVAPITASASVMGCELSAVALAQARSDGVVTKVPLMRGDARHLPFADGVFDGVTSFGYGSVGSYGEPAIQIEIARVLKPDGWLILDLRNHLSLWFVVFRPLWVIEWVRRYFGHGKRQYHCGRFGVSRYFGASGFDVRATRSILSFPPIAKSRGAAPFLSVERAARRLLLNHGLGRVLIVLFEKRALST